MKYSKNGKTLPAEISNEQREAAGAKAKQVALIHKAAMEGDWEAAAWWLEKNYPEEYGA